jgi:hypothetical protein
MKRRIENKMDTYMTKFKNDIREKSKDLGFLQNENMNLLLQYVYDYEGLVLEKEDFMKRKRVKNDVSVSDRCCAKRANDEQCTRRRKDGSEFCGTHSKGTPHGIMEIDEEKEKIKTKKIEVWTQDIRGIIYYIDKSENVYQAEDIMMNKENIKRIGKYKKNGDEWSVTLNV